MKQFDIIVVGAGIAGASVAAHLAASRKVAVLEMEERPGYHTTGRSAASYEPNYGPPPMLAFTRASAEFFHGPPKGFTETTLLTPRDSLFLMPEGQEQQAGHLLQHSVGLDEISEQESQAMFPVLRRNYARRSFLDRHTGDMDVELLHRGYLKWFRERGGSLFNAHLVKALTRRNNTWIATTPHDEFEASILVNAAGAWGDVIAHLAGARPIGLQPKRRSIGVVPIKDHSGSDTWPMVTDVGETWYCKPQSGKLIVSSADATPVEPHDAYADDMAIAEGVERLMQATTLDVTRLDHSWGGLRTFAPDGNPVVGFDPATDGFFWLVGQGGYGIQSAPALSQSAAALVLGKAIASNILDLGLDVSHIQPKRFQP